MGGKKRPPISNAEKKRLLSFFDNLPEGKSNRNKFKLDDQQNLAMMTLRKHFTPVQIEQMLNIGVYRVHQSIAAAKIVVKRLEQEERRRLEEERKRRELGAKEEKLQQTDNTDESISGELIVDSELSVDLSVDKTNQQTIDNTIQQTIHTNNSIILH